MAAPKIYGYIDETGQDSLGQIFVVAVVTVGRDRDAALERLEVIEQATGKGRSPWRSTRPDRQTAYIERVLAEVKVMVYYAVHPGAIDYGRATLETIAWALDERAPDRDYKAVVIIDGFPKHEARRMGVGLRHRGIPIKKVRGARDESNPLTRLADSMAGFIRDAEEGKGDRPARLAAAHAMIRRLQRAVP